MSEKILEIKDERLSFFTPAGEVKALNGVSFSMNQGDVLGIVGESGSGKSVTAYSIMGLTAYPGRLVGGTVWFNGHQIDKMTEKEFRKIRGNELKRIPYLLIVGEKEEAEGLVSVRAQGEGDKGQMTMEAFRDLIAGLVKEEIDANKLEKK